MSEGYWRTTCEVKVLTISIKHLDAFLDEPDRQRGLFPRMWDLRLLTLSNCALLKQRPVESLPHSFEA